MFTLLVGIPASIAAGAVCGNTYVSHGFDYGAGMTCLAGGLIGAHLSALAGGLLVGFGLRGNKISTPGADTSASSLRPFIGLRAGGVAGLLVYPNPQFGRADVEAFAGGVASAFSLGLTYERIQFELEISPGSTFMQTRGHYDLGIFHANATIGYLLPIHSRVSWPLRIGLGAGFLFGDDFSGFGLGGRSTSGLFEARADAVGVEIELDSAWRIEITPVSVRYFTDLGVNEKSASFLVWMPTIGTSVSY